MSLDDVKQVAEEVRRKLSYVASSKTADEISAACLALIPACAKMLLVIVEEKIEQAEWEDERIRQEIEVLKRRFSPTTSSVQSSDPPVRNETPTPHRESG